MIENALALVGSVAPILQNAGTSYPAIPPKAAAALAVGLAAFGAGYAERGIGAAAVGAIAEDDDMFGRGLILTVLPETLVILALVVVFVVPDWSAVV
ncbi:F0F1 ATP synthase subunit C [Halorientalis salina]|jgi:V/A-type H+-transporting ATPase subunit K|uniref:F0F1 ATP synthase subunit C n=1 Tax=Halorientalis salina TaxID=2932266 RepID=UPI0010AC2FA4|nr:F0F1 ATP synthase subunit C [Halorientalis salina]